jgi:predicted RNA-binding protein with PIN domain
VIRGRGAETSSSREIENQMEKAIRMIDKIMARRMRRRR